LKKKAEKLVYEVKFKLRRISKAKAAFYILTDILKRRYWYRMGLDTPVVYTENYEY